MRNLKLYPYKRPQLLPTARAMEYIIYEALPLDTGQSCEDEPDTACPDTEDPDMDNPCLENQP